MTSIFKKDKKPLKSNSRIKRELKGWQLKLTAAIAIGMSLYHLYYSAIAITTPWLYRTTHVCLAMILVFMLTPASKKSPKDKISIIDWILIAGALFVAYYIFRDLRSLELRAGVMPNRMDIFVGILLLLLVLETVRRYIGLALVITALLFLSYALFGYMIPGRFNLPPYSFQRIISYLNSTYGVYGIAVSTSATYVFLFVLFGSFLVSTGVGDVFIKLSQALSGSFRGGPAKVSVLSSALFGSISGSASSNIVTTGAFTIPLMNKVGYSKEFAASVECCSSIGGLFMPPIMGAGGFIMAEMLGISYATVMKAAIVPALLYFAAIFLLVDFEAGRKGLVGYQRKDLPNMKDVLLKEGYLLLPVLLLIYLLAVVRLSPVYAAIWAMVSTVFVAAIKKETRLGVKDILKCLETGAKNALTVAVATSCAGIVVGIVSLTGVGLTFSGLLIDVASGSYLPTLIIAMIVTIFLGMGLPITATYITVAAIIAPALIQIGITPIAAHLFLYFFAAISAFTPPVCLGAYVAAGVANCDPMKVAVQSMKLGAIAFILPYMFVYGPELLLIGEPLQVMMSVTTSFIGLVAFAGGIHGWLGKKIILWKRAILILGGLFLIHVSLITNLIGLGLIAVVFLIERINKKSIVIQ